MKLEISNEEARFLLILLHSLIIDVKTTLEEYPNATTLRIHLEFLERIYNKIKGA
jgi:hypothetical protein